MDETLWKVIAVIVTAAATVIGALIAYAGVKAANALKRIEQETKNRELVKSSLEFLTGGTQKRTVGIALLKDRVEDGMISKKTAEIILQGQAEHLRDANNPDAKRPIEKHNLKTIETLLSGWKKPPSGKQNK
ncbi:MAG TPA: hypothetical protein VJ731_14890 [Terriglobales bacterium]|nr:hypothetical protein [Terriglobales bacterium]